MAPSPYQHKAHFSRLHTVGKNEAGRDLGLLNLSLPELPPVDLPGEDRAARGMLKSHQRACRSLATSILSLSWDPGRKGDRGYGEDAGGSGAGYRLLCSQLMFDLEQCAKCASPLRNTLICQRERTPAFGQPGWERELCGEKHPISGRRGEAVTAEARRWLYVTVCKTALKKGCCHFLQLWTGSGGSTMCR